MVVYTSRQTVERIALRMSLHTIGTPPPKKVSPPKKKVLLRLFLNFWKFYQILSGIIRNERL